MVSNGAADRQLVRGWRPREQQCEAPVSQSHSSEPSRPPSIHHHDHLHLTLLLVEWTVPYCMYSEKNTAQLQLLEPLDVVA